MPQVPASLTRAIRLLYVVVAWTGLTALLTVVFRDDLVRNWAQGNRAARKILDEGGLDALEASSINVPGFVPLAVVLFVVFASFAGVLVVFLRGGHGWARMTLTATVLFSAFSTVVGLGRDLPGLFVVVSAVVLVLYAALLFLLWHKDTSAYFRAF